MKRVLVAVRREVRKPLNRFLNRIDNPVIVLVYHRVTDLRSDPQLLAVGPENFRAQMRSLKENFSVLRFEEDWLKAKGRSVVVTFDDGYADNLLEALPILEEERVPATFFISTGTIGSEREFWWDELERILLEKKTAPAKFVLKDRDYGREWRTGTREYSEILYREIFPLLKRLVHARRQDWLDQMRDWAGLSDEGRKSHRPLTPEELRRLADSRYVTLGAHTVSHPALSGLSDDAQREEILHSKKHLEEWVKRPVKFFSYPFGGRRDYNRSSIKVCREFGFEKVASNFSGQVHSWTSRYEIPRNLVRNWSKKTFEEHLGRFLFH